jgi:hypothetical protein
MQGLAEDSLTLGQRLSIALVPSSVPALMLIVSLGLALIVGDLPDAFEQIAGGALLITYIKELFPKVMEQGDAAVAYLVPKAPSGGELQRAKVGSTLLMVVCIFAAVVVQDAADGFPAVHAAERRLSEAETFTATSTIAYYVGFFVDGVVLAYDDEPIRCDLSLVKKMVMSLVFAIDNFLDGFGLVPVMESAYGDAWVLFFLLFSACVLAGAVSTALLLHFLPSPLFHLAWLSFSTSFILIGAIQLMAFGLNTYVMIGVALVWVVLFIGDLAEAADEAQAEELEEKTKTSLWRRRHHKFVGLSRMLSLGRDKGLERMVEE